MISTWRAPFCDKVAMEKWCIQKYGHWRAPWQVLAPYERPNRYGYVRRSFLTFQEAAEHVSKYV